MASYCEVCNGAAEEENASGQHSRRPLPSGLLPVAAAAAAADGSRITPPRLRTVSASAQARARPTPSPPHASRRNSPQQRGNSRSPPHHQQQQQQQRRETPPSRRSPLGRYATGTHSSSQRQRQRPPQEGSTPERRQQQLRAWADETMTPPKGEALHVMLQRIRSAVRQAEGRAPSPDPNSNTAAPPSPSSSATTDTSDKGNKDSSGNTSSGDVGGGEQRQRHDRRHHRVRTSPAKRVPSPQDRRKPNPEREGEGKEEEEAGSGGGRDVWLRQFRLLLEAAEGRLGGRLQRLERDFAQLCTLVSSQLRHTEAAVESAQKQQRRLQKRLQELSEEKQQREKAGAGAAAQAAQPPPSPPPAPAPALTCHQLLMVVRSAPPAEREELARLLLPALAPYWQSEARVTAAEQQQWVLTHVQAALQDVEAASRPPPPPPLPPSCMDFGSAEAFDAHLRAAAREVLAQEDRLRYSAATQEWRQEAAEWEARLERQRRECEGGLARLQRQQNAQSAALRRDVDSLQEVVERLAKDLAAARQSAAEQYADVRTSLAREGAARQQEQAHWEARWQRQAAEAEDARTALRARQRRVDHAALAAGELMGGTDADALRSELLVPVVTHVRKLLAAHQRVVDAVVEKRCTRAEHSVAEERHSWDQSVADLRSRLASLRRDTHSAFAELSSNLDVACPGM